MKTLDVSKIQLEMIGIIERMGPEKHEYPLIKKIVNNIQNESEEQFFKELFKPILNEHTLYGHTYLKPFGYAGDYLLIERMYQQHISNDPRWQKWDMHYHTHDSATAVINRKAYFVKTMEELCNKKSGPLQVLILGSGPATDVHEFFTKNPNADITFTLLDIDQRAIDYATQKNKKFLHKIQFIRMNVLRFVPNIKFDLIWSAGLFDYLNDRLFTGLVNRYKENLQPDGEMIIGNFSSENPSRKCMEIMVEWYLIHRSSDHLKKLAMEAGIPENYIEVDKEPLGINLFLRIQPRDRFPGYLFDFKTKVNAL